MRPLLARGCPRDRRAADRAVAPHPVPKAPAGAYARRGGGDRGARPTSARGRPMVTARLFLSGVAASGRPGANPGEKDQAQDFVVDLDVEVEVGDDELTSTADYRTLIQIGRA